MAGAQLVLALPYKANEALVKHRFVKLQADEAVDQADTAGERCLGLNEIQVSTAEAALGKSVGVQVLGLAWVEASEAISLFEQVSTTNNGRAKGAASTEIPLGFAMQAAAAAGDLIPVFLTPGLPALA